MVCTPVALFRPLFSAEDWFYSSESLLHAVLSSVNHTVLPRSTDSPRTVVPYRTVCPYRTDSLVPYCLSVPYCRLVPTPVLPVQNTPYRTGSPVPCCCTYRYTRTVQYGTAPVRACTRYEIWRTRSRTVLACHTVSPVPYCPKIRYGYRSLLQPQPL